MHSQIIMNGIISGSIYALIAIGYTMIYGIGKFINFAHGEVFMAGAFSYYLLHIQIGVPILPAVAVSVILVSLLGVLIEKIAYRRFRDTSRFIPLINTIGISIFLQSLFLMLFGVNTKSLKTNFQFEEGFSIFNAKITSIQIIIIAATAVSALLLFLFLKKTKFGKALRATSEDREIASILGININMTISGTFAIGSALAAIAGILIGYDQNISPTMGITTGIKAFTAAVLGGIGNIPGAVAGGIAIGMIETYAALYISSGYKEAIIFLILLSLLFFRPNGIFTSKVRKG